ncbi:unnamed protein product [Symbiodinium natans]|uniref:Uncharacterized protein n=1 Tax=Symbiodinium natans TaxID=878477 RepID=A0A812TDC8_9DINO|nr:unnamed protein product [Symbiodinium natans]
MSAMRPPSPSRVSPVRINLLDDPEVRPRLASLMNREVMTARTRRGSIAADRSPHRRAAFRRLTRRNSQFNGPGSFSLGRHTRVNDILATFGEEETITSRRPSSLPGGLDSLGHGGAGLGYLQDRWKDLESAMQPQLRNRALTEDLRRDLVQFAAPDQDLNALVKEGFITEDFSRLVYDKFKNEDEPEFLHDLQLEKCGGLNAVRELDSPQKYFWFFVLIISVVFNIWYLIHLDWQIFTTYFREVFHTWDLHGIAVRLSNGGGSQSKQDIQAELFDDPMFKGSIFGMISDPTTRLTIVTAAVMVSIWEVGWLMTQLVWVVYILYMACCEQSEYKRYNAIGYFFQTLLPQASTFSAVKLMARVHPSLILNEYQDWVTSFSERGLCGHRRNTIGYIMLTMSFIIFHAFCATAAVSAFSVKMLAVSFKVVNPDISWWYRLFSILATLNQIMGAVYIDRLLQDRVFLFVFGGRDSTYEDDELAYKNAYMTRLVREIWVEYWQQGYYFSALVLLATFDHYDLQWLMIEPTDEDDENYMLQRLGLASPKRAVSAPAEGLTARPKKAASGLDHTTWWENLWTMLGCHSISRVNSSPDLETVQEEYHESPVNSLHSARKDEDGDAAQDVDGDEVREAEKIPEHVNVEVRTWRSLSENLSHKASKPMQVSLKLPSSDALGPVASERSGQDESALSETPRTKHSWISDQDPISESSQPLLFPVQDPAGSESLMSRESTSSFGMSAIARAVESRCNAWGDSWNGWTEGVAHKRTGYLAWADGWSDTGIPMSRSDTNDVVDLEHLFTSHEVDRDSHVDPTGDSLV